MIYPIYLHLSNTKLKTSNFTNPFIRKGMFDRHEEKPVNNPNRKWWSEPLANWTYWWFIIFEKKRCICHAFTSFTLLVLHPI